MINFLLICGIFGAGYYGIKNKDPKLLGLAAGKLLVFGIINGKNKKRHGKLVN